MALNARRHVHASILDRWINDDRHLESQLARGWTIEKVEPVKILGSNDLRTPLQQGANGEIRAKLCSEEKYRWKHTTMQKIAPS